MEQLQEKYIRLINDVRNGNKTYKILKITKEFERKVRHLEFYDGDFSRIEINLLINKWKEQIIKKIIIYYFDEKDELIQKYEITKSSCYCCYLKDEIKGNHEMIHDMNHRIQDVFMTAFYCSVIQQLSGDEMNINNDGMYYTKKQINVKTIPISAFD